MKVGQTAQTFGMFSQRAMTSESSHRLISSDKVEGTPVYRPNGESLGRIEHLMIEKRSGRVAYAVMNFGGFLGIGERHYPLPWSILVYNEQLGGYEVTLTDEQLRGAPHYPPTKAWDWSDQRAGARVDHYYGIIPYWD